MKKQYYINNVTMDNGFCVVGTIYSFLTEGELFEFANDHGWELEKVEAPDYISDILIDW